ncbi:Pre-mRNA polyadenylation factor fip1 [Penicillium cataractarum]|uniref:Pre-mRNA polyadenylation factor fip1 n=1 Tax=Penicillium cataractarum TaxID=2100454 RepID=A0A9W9V9N9_9EURO|nr:Pre-mRNA polyadenylation factor fip1 [Penicillium cataractarum]KAJ5371396.1 Pre-mRNA polyadenylation factor fip1 [Penicillium cataractarum]
MEDEEDDFYDPTDSVPTGQAQHNAHNATLEQQQDGYEDEEEEEVEDDDDDFNIITEAPADAPPPEISHPRHASLRQEPQRPPSADSSIISKSATPTATPHLDVSTPVPAAAAPIPKQTVPLRPGSSYPAIHTSTIDVNGNPVHPSTGKTIMATDMDADFPTDDKPWRRPGTDVTDFFNYGFDEFTWVSYCLKQQEVRKEVGDQKKQMDDMSSFLGMGMPPMPGAAPGPGAAGPGGAAPMPGMPGMPDMNPDMMQGMLASMMAQGLDPSSMDPMAFMQHAQTMMGGQPGGGPQGQPGFGGQGQGQGFGQGGQGQMGYGGYEQRGNYGGGRGRGRRW